MRSLLIKVLEIGVRVHKGNDGRVDYGRERKCMERKRRWTCALLLSYAFSCCRSIQEEEINER